MTMRSPTPASTLPARGLKPLLKREPVPPATPDKRGYSLLYRMDRVNHCPGCGRTHWIVGRVTAECAFCETALPLSEGGNIGSGLFHRRTFEMVA